ncbi:MAG: tail fiber domain-containing protein, partial [Patescibacteria group bacterium]
FSDDVNITGSATTSNTLQVTSGLATGGAQPNSTTTANFGGNVLIQGRATTTSRMVVNTTGGATGNSVAGVEYSLNLPNVANQTGYGYAYGWFSASDGRFKVNQQPLDYGLEDLMKLNPKRYTQYGGYIGDDGQAVYIGEGAESIGLIAQEVYGVIPEVTNGAGNELWAIDYDRLTPVVIKSIQELATKVDQLLARLDRLDNGGTETESQQPTADAPAPTGGQVRIFDVEVLGNIIGRQNSDFFGLMTVWAEADFRQNVFFKGLAYFNQDTAGVAVITAGATSTEVTFTGTYLVVPRITALPKNNPGALFWASEQSTTGFKINIAEPQPYDVAFDWIALAVKSDLATSLPPTIEEFNLPLTEISLDQGMELKAKVFDPDTKTEDLSYTWSISPKVGEFNGDSNTALVWWQITSPIPQDTEVTITLEVSDGKNSTAQSKVVKVLGEVFGCLNPEASNFNPLARFDDGSCQTSGQEEPSVVLGCTDQTALNYNSSANQDDGTCTYPTVEQPTTPETPVAQEPISTSTEPIAQEGTDGVGGPE